MSVLDIGSGYGGMALYLAEAFEATVTGVTLSTEQLAIAEKRAAERGLEAKVRFLLQDYRDVTRPFRPDHLGRHVRACWSRFLRALFPAVLTICSIPKASLSSIRSAGFMGRCTPIPGWRSTYFRAVPVRLSQRWRRSSKDRGSCSRISRFFGCTMRTPCERGGNGFLPIARRRRRSTDDRFCRMWEFYLAGFEAAFRFDDLVVLQFQLAKRLDTVPRTRKYLY